MNEFIRKHKLEISYIIFMVFVFMLLIFTIPFDKAPDERSRYLLPDFMYQYGTLPIGTDPRVAIPNWGVSYAFSPFLSYMISAVFMKITSFFTQGKEALLISARMAEALFSTITIVYVMKISKKLFHGLEQWLFIILCGCLPMFIFVSSYVNNDALSLTSSAIIIYAWIQGRETKWNRRSCITLIVGLSICVLSYQNAYGYILLSIILYVYELFLSYKEKRMNSMLIKGAIIVAAVIILGGWFYIRNYFLYHGDFLGMATNKKLAEANAIDSLKPHNRGTPQNKGLSLYYMLFKMEWLKNSYLSFIGIFDNMLLFLPGFFYKIYDYVFIGGIFGILMNTIQLRRIKKDKLVFYLLMLGSAILPIVFSLYYSYTNDYQPQGRYVLPMLIPLMFFISKGLIVILNKLGYRKPYGIVGIILVLMTLSVYMLANVFVNAYF